jgi:hypothetical protein
VHGGTGDTINLVGGSTLTLYGTDEMTFLPPSGNITVNDFSTGLDLKIGPTAGDDILSNIAPDPSGVVDLIGGIGGFTTTSQVLSALKSDRHGGTLLSFGKSSSLDFTGLAPSQLHESNFQIGWVFASVYESGPTIRERRVWADSVEITGVAAARVNKFNEPKLRSKR